MGRANYFFGWRIDARFRQGLYKDAVSKLLRFWLERSMSVDSGFHPG